MAVKFSIVDGTNNGYEVKVTPRNQIITAPLDFSTFYNATASVACTAYNLIEPELRKQFVITDIIIHGDKSVGVCDATVTIYEASSPTSTTVATSIFIQDITKQETVALDGLNIITNVGKWINIKTTDNNIQANIGGYFVKYIE